MPAPLHEQKRDLPLYISKETSAGKTYIVTGANVGLGMEAAKHLVAVDAAKVIMACRNVPAGEAAKAKIEAETGKTGIAEVWELDLASFDSVKAFAKKAIAELDRIDALIENAAVAMGGPARAEGHAFTITVNVISTFLLAVLLLPKLSESAKKFGTLPHLAIVGSRSILQYQNDWDAVKDDPIKTIDAQEVPGNVYPVSKLIVAFCVFYLGGLIPVSRTGVVVNCVEPGLCITELSRNAPEAFRTQLKKMHAEFGRTAEDGSRTLLHGAVAGKESHGKMLDACEIVDQEDILPPWIIGDEGKPYWKICWDAVAKELEEIEPGCVKKILE